MGDEVWKTGDGDKVGAGTEIRTGEEGCVCGLKFISGDGGGSWMGTRLVRRSGICGSGIFLGF